MKLDSGLEEPGKLEGGHQKTRKGGHRDKKQTFSSRQIHTTKLGIRVHKSTAKKASCFGQLAKSFLELGLILVNLIQAMRLKF